MEIFRWLLTIQGIEANLRQKENDFSVPVIPTWLTFTSSENSSTSVSNIMATLSAKLTLLLLCCYCYFNVCTVPRVSYALENLKSNLWLYHLNELNEKAFFVFFKEVQKRMELTVTMKVRRIIYKLSVPIPFSGTYFRLINSQKFKRGI